MNKLLATFLRTYTFHRQLGILIGGGILMLALLSSVVGAWLGNERVRDNMLDQGRNITENLARQSTLALLYSSADNAVEAARATLSFPGVIGLEIRDDKQQVLLVRGQIDLSAFSTQARYESGEGAGGKAESSAILDAESAAAWRFIAPVYAQLADSPFGAELVPELLGYVTVVVSKAVLSQMTMRIFAANLATSFSFALLFLFLIRLMTDRMTQPLYQLSRNMESAEAGDLQVRAELDGPRDIADMAHAFNSMMTVLETREEEVRQLNLELERRVAERTMQLEAVNKELEAFSYSVSHDLRAPLRAIDGFSHILLSDYTDKLDEDGKRMLSLVRGNTRRMGQLIEDILQFSRTGRLELSHSMIDMEAMAQAVLAELRGQGVPAGLVVDIGQLPAAAGDSAMMRQVWVNLLSNAIKFSSKRETPTIKVGGAIEGDEIVYHVKDNGVGFDMQYADKLFGVFQRLHSMEEFEGTGIGLAIVKRIVTRHGGRVWAEGRLNEGAALYFTLPVSNLPSRKETS